MADASEDKKIEHINLKVVGPNGDEVAFKIKKSTPFKKLMDAYAGKMGVEASSLRFMFDGERITAEGTPELLEMEDEDQIQVTSQQTGGKKAE